MRKTIFIFTACFIIATVALPQRSGAQIPIVSLVTSAIKKIIVAIDIKVQQLQNQTIKLQQAEQQLENTKTMGSLKDISGWLGKEKDLFHNYYDELQKVRSVIASYQQVKQIIEQQAQLVSEYKHSWGLFRQDKNFSASEISYIAGVYNGILDESLRNITELTATISSFSTQMNDGERMQAIHRIATAMQRNVDDLRRFNGTGVQLSLQRSVAQQNTAAVKQLYGLTK